MTFCDSAGMADVRLGMAPSWYPLEPPRPLKTPKVTPSDFCDLADVADVWLGLAPS